MTSDPYDGTDVGDLLENLADVVPMITADHRAAAKEGRDALAALDDADAIADLLGDPVRVAGVGMLAHLHPLEWEAVQVRLEADAVGNLRVRQALIRAVKEAARGAAAAVADSKARQATTAVFRLLADAGIQAPRGLKAPYGYTVDKSGIWLGETHVTSRPIVPLGYLRHVETGEVSVRLAWTTPGHQVLERYVPRTALDEPRALKAAAPMLPLVPEPKALTAYFAAFEDVNGAVLPVSRLTDRLGWHGREFVLPSTPAESLAYQGDPAKGESAIVADVRSAGTLEGWRERFRAAPPLVRLAMLASACTPLLEPCQAPGFVVDLAGLSSAGKTVALVAAATAWGPPRGAVLGTWESTKAALMARAGILHSLPVILDDTKHAQHSPTLIPEVVYAITGGRERERGHRDGGMRKSATWRTCLISTGEQRITMFSPDKGTRGRVLGFFASPFATGADAKDYVETLGDDFGVAGPAVAAFATERWDELELAHRRLTREWSRGADGQPLQLGELATRLMPHVATMALAAEALDLAAEAWPALQMAQAAAMDADDAGDVHQRAFDDLVGWCYANSHRLWDGAKDRQEPSGRWVPNDIAPPGGWAGRRMPDGSLWLLGSVFDAELTRMGHRPAECVDVWAARGWCSRATEPQRLPTGRVRGRRLFPTEAEDDA